MRAKEHQELTLAWLILRACLLSILMLQHHISGLNVFA
jgi:hypothetical protein